MKVSYPCSGLLAPGTPVSWQRSDDGRDLVIPRDAIWQAAGDFECIGIGHDRPWPGGFGPNYPRVIFTTGPFALKDHTGNWVKWYWGHNSSLVSQGERGGFGHPLARPDQGRPSEIGITVPYPPGDGGWTEFGQTYDNGSVGPFDGNGHFFDRLLRASLVVNVPDKDLRYGAKGWRVIGLTANLATCGYLPHYKWTFDWHVHGAVVAFKEKHHLPLLPLPLKPGQDNGIVDTRVSAAIQHAADWCKKHGREYKSS